MNPITIKLELSRQPTPYDIMIGHGISKQIGVIVQHQLGLRRCVIVTDTQIAPLYLLDIERSLQIGGHSVLPSCVIPAGEASKSWDGFQDILRRILELDIDRKTLIIALGGGVVGDLAGFAASVLLRGLDLVHVPTTLLAQIDSAIGGKNGIDTEAGKNMVGTFHQPRLVLVDPAFLASLPPRELRAGYAEIVKCGMIGDKAFFDWCVMNGNKVVKGEDLSIVVEAITRACQFKAYIVNRDDREDQGIGGTRILLNLGHTFGHALEAAAGFGDLLRHGEAVSIGMAMAFDLSAQLGLCLASDAKTVADHLASVGLPTKPPTSSVFETDRLMSFMRQDKKNRDGNLTLILARGIGICFQARDISEEAVRKVWARFLT